MHRLLICAAACALLAVPQAARAQATTVYTAAGKQHATLVNGNILKAAEKMPDEHFAFKPTPDVRSFAQLLGHIADASYMICSRASAGTNPNTVKIEATVSTKAGLVKALTEAFAYCDGVFAKLDDTTGAEVVDFFTGKQPKLSVLAFNTAHNFEHYGNIATYMRLKGLVPPSSERR
jgi:uncharacterized damage-inducible protein DinB